MRKVTSFSWNFLWLLSLSGAQSDSGVAVEERRGKQTLFTRDSRVLQLQKPCKSISFCHLLRILLLHLRWHLLLVIILCHLLSQFLHLFLQVTFLCHQFSHFLLHINETLRWGDVGGRCEAEDNSFKSPGNFSSESECKIVEQRSENVWLD